MKPYAENKSLIKQRLHFQMPKIIDITSFSETETWVEVFLSPYNSFMLIQTTVKRFKHFWKLFQYKNGSLINYQKYDNMNDEFGEPEFKGCLFMKNTDEFIVWYYKEIKFFRIEQNQKWKTIQVIEKIPVSQGALSTDEQTFFVCATNLSLYKKCQQQTRNQIWVCFFQVALTYFYIDRFFLDQACNTFIATYLSSLWIVKNYKNLKIRKLLICKQSQRPIGLSEDQFIVIRNLIIQWNKQSRKILKKYKPKIGNLEITLLSYNQQSRFNLASLNEQLIFWELQNGKIRPLQILKDQFSPDSAQIGNNGQLLMKHGHYSSHPIVFYEQTQ